MSACNTLCNGEEMNHRSTRPISGRMNMSDCSRSGGMGGLFIDLSLSGKTQAGPAHQPALWGSHSIPNAPSLPTA